MSPQATAPSLVAAAGTCPDPTGHIMATSGVIAMGPFEDESAQPQAATVRKLWVWSQRKGPDDLTLQVTGPDGQTQTTTRGPSGAQVANAAQFWPGEIPVPVSGTYRIEATIGADHLCVMARYNR